MMKRIAIALSLMLMMPFCAWSEDIVATWQHQGGNTMKLAMRDENRIRMDTGENAYMLVSGKKVYMVTGQAGDWTVMDMDQLSGVMSKFGAQVGNTAQAADDYQSTFKKTGRSETIAGYKGTVYVVETKDAAGKLIDSSEIVFSKHKDIRQVNKAWMAIATRLGSILGGKSSLALDQASKKAEMEGYGGILRVGEMKLTRVEKPSLSAAYYELPKGARMTDIDPGMSGGKPAAGGEADSTFVKDLGDEAGNAAQEEVKQNTIDEVKKGVGGIFKKLFK